MQSALALPRTYWLTKASAHRGATTQATPKTTSININHNPKTTSTQNLESGRRPGSARPSLLGKPLTSRGDSESMRELNRRRLQKHQHFDGHRAHADDGGGGASPSGCPVPGGSRGGWSAAPAPIELDAWQRLPLQRNPQGKLSGLRLGHNAGDRFNISQDFRLKPFYLHMVAPRPSALAKPHHANDCRLPMI